MTATADTPVEARPRRAMAGLLLGAALLIVAFWVAWLTHRSLVASESGAAYAQFEDAFPLADGWLALCLVAASYCLLTARRAALFGSSPRRRRALPLRHRTCSTTCSTVYGARAGTG